MSALLQVSGVTVRYGRVEAVSDVSLSVAHGEGFPMRAVA